MLIGKENQAYAACFDYGQRLLEAVQETPEVNDFRIRCPGKFRSICFLHLSFAIDVPLNLFHEFNSSDQIVNVPSGRRMFSRLRRCNGGKSLENVYPNFILLHRSVTLVAVHNTARNNSILAWRS